MRLIGAFALQSRGARRSPHPARTTPTTSGPVSVGSAPCAVRLTRDVRVRGMAPATMHTHTHGMKADDRRPPRGEARHQSDPGDLGWIVVCAVDGGPFMPLQPSWE